MAHAHGYLNAISSALMPHFQATQPEDGALFRLDRGRIDRDLSAGADRSCGGRQGGGVVAVSGGIAVPQMRREFRKGTVRRTRLRSPADSATRKVG